MGLSWSVVSGLARLGVQVYSHQQVPVFGTLAAWADKIKENFDKYFWIGSKSGAQVRKDKHLSHHLIIDTIDIRLSPILNM